MFNICLYDCQTKTYLFINVNEFQRKCSFCHQTTKDFGIVTRKNTSGHDNAILFGDQVHEANLHLDC